MEMEFASLEDFDLLGLDQDSFAGDTLDIFQIERALLSKLSSCENLGHKRALTVLCTICGFHFSNESSTYYTSRYQVGSKRSLNPNDISSAQIQTLSVIAPKIKHPLLRARISDVCWIRDKKLRDLGRLASSSFLEATNDYKEDRLSTSIATNYLPPSAVIEHLERALLIDKTLNIQNKKSLTSSWSNCLEEAISTVNVGGFCRLSRMGPQFKICTWLEVAENCEKLLNSTEIIPIAARELWKLASYSYGRSDLKGKARDCAIQGAEQLLLIRDQASSSMLKASWTRDLISEFRRIGKLKERVDDLIKELERFSEEAMEEYTTSTFKIDTGKERKIYYRIFSKLPFTDSLREISTLNIIPDKIRLHAEILKRRNSSFINSIFSMAYLDSSGKLRSKGAQIDWNSAPTVDWFDHECLTDLDVYYRLHVSGIIYPACQAISRKLSVDDKHFLPIVRASPFVPEGYENIFAAGFVHFFKGDMISAAHLLIPQIENSLRHIIAMTGNHTYHIPSDETEENQTLSGLLKRSDMHLSAVFDENYIYLLKLLFDFKAGPSLRHKLAHGLLHTAECHDAPAIYACWLVYHLCCFPLRHVWAEGIAPQIEQMAE